MTFTSCVDPGCPRTVSTHLREEQYEPKCCCRIFSDCSIASERFSNHQSGRVINRRPNQKLELEAEMAALLHLWRITRHERKHRDMADPRRGTPGLQLSPRLFHSLAPCGHHHHLLELSSSLTNACPKPRTEARDNWYHWVGVAILSLLSAKTLALAIVLGGLVLSAAGLRRRWSGGHRGLILGSIPGEEGGRADRGGEPVAYLAGR